MASLITISHISNPTQVVGQSLVPQVRITGIITGLAPGSRAWHIHDFGDISRGLLDAEDACNEAHFMIGGNSTGNHFNPHLVGHGGPTSLIRFVFA
jgi:Cu/Zn superoxide dismutase